MLHLLVPLNEVEKWEGKNGILKFVKQRLVYSVLGNGLDATFFA